MNKFTVTALQFCHFITVFKFLGAVRLG